MMPVRLCFENKKIPSFSFTKEKQITAIGLVRREATTGNASAVRRLQSV